MKYLLWILNMYKEIFYGSETGTPRKSYENKFFNTRKKNVMEVYLVNKRCYTSIQQT